MLIKALPVKLHSTAIFRSGTQRKWPEEVTSSVWHIYTKKNILGTQSLVLLLPKKVTSSVCNICTEKGVLGTKAFVLMLLQEVTLSVWNMHTKMDALHARLEVYLILWNLTKIVIIFDARIPIFTFFYSLKLVKIRKSCQKVRLIHEKNFDPENEYSS